MAGIDYGTQNCNEVVGCIGSRQMCLGLWVSGSPKGVKVLCPEDVSSLNVGSFEGVGFGMSRLQGMLTSRGCLECREVLVV